MAIGNRIPCLLSSYISNEVKPSQRVIGMFPLTLRNLPLVIVAQQIERAGVYV